jgi:tetratricopeptide (TPR) repeat protein
MPASKKKQSAPLPSPPPPSPGRRALFWAITLSIPLLFFLVLEGGLRAAGFGASYPLFVEVDQPPDYRVQARDVARRYFQNTRDVPTPMHDLFLTRKPEGGLRIFVQGGSTAAGFPFYHGGAFSRMLETRLRATFPDRPVEVVNTSMAAVNSFTLLDLTKEILREAPDAVLIYAGHNEYYGAFGVGSTESFGGSPALVNWYLQLRKARTVQLLHGGLARMAALATPVAEEHSSSLMGRMVGRQSIPYGSRDYERGVRQFEGNLRALLQRYRHAGVPVFVATLVANERDHPPFATAFQRGTDEAAWRARFDVATAALDRGDISDAIDILEELTLADSLAADGFYALGLAFDAAGDSGRALEAFRAASDRDVLRFRAPSVFNDIIRRLAVEEGAVVVDVETHMRRFARDGIIGSAEMLEHLHPTVEGYFLISDAFYEALLGSETLDLQGAQPVVRDQARSLVRLTLADSLVGVLRVRHLVSAWPFSPLGAHSSPVPFPERSLTEGRIALDLYQSRATWLEAMENLARALEEEGRTRESVRTREAMIQSYPMLSEPYSGLARLYVRLGDDDRAADHFRLAIHHGDRSGTAHGLLGALLLQRGLTALHVGDRAAADHLEQARAMLEQARSLNPRNPQTLYNLSGAYTQLARYDEARQTAEALLRLQPEHVAARQLLASLPR